MNYFSRMEHVRKLMLDIQIDVYQKKEELMKQVFITLNLEWSEATFKRITRFYYPGINGYESYHLDYGEEISTHLIDFKFKGQSLIATSKWITNKN